MLSFITGCRSGIFLATDSGGLTHPCRTELLTEPDLDWADLVLIGGMLKQQGDAVHLINLALGSKYRK